MSFPQTSKTLIFRVVTEGKEQDWRRFLNDYWLPVCRFAQQRAGIKIEDAEDVASETFEIILRNHLLERWVSDCSSKLRTLLCTVVRHILGNRARIQKGRNRLLTQNAAELRNRSDLPTIKSMDATEEELDLFFAAWVEGILLQAIDKLMTQYHQTGKGDYFRVLYSHICEQMKSSQIAKMLNIPQVTVENHYKAARKRLAAVLSDIVDEHVRRYCQTQEVEEEYNLEWSRIGLYLKDKGGLEKVIARVYLNEASVNVVQRQKQGITAALRQITKLSCEKPEDPAR